MTGSGQPKPLTVMCVDDNPAVARALQTKLMRVGGFEWLGSLPSADELLDACRDGCPDIVLLDVDMPGKSPFDALTELVGTCLDTRAVMFSGHVRRELVERSIDSGAWGYASKNDGEDELVAVLRRVAGGELAFSPEARRAYLG